jgi:uncharacterized protein
MKKTVLVVGVVSALLGGLWLLQGLGVVHVRPILCLANCEPIQGPSSAWASIGFFMVTAGVIAICFSLWRHGQRSFSGQGQVSNGPAQRAGPVGPERPAAARNVVRTWIAGRPAVSFYLLALALSWGYWLTLLAQGQHVVPGGTVTHFPGLLGPLLAAVAVTAVIGGRNGLRELLARMCQLGPHWPRNLVLALSPLALGVVAYLAMHFMGKPLPSATAFAHFPGLPVHWPLASVVATVLVVNGLGEETGWRGFLTERLLLTHGRFKATLWVALLWSFWHLPLFWLNVGMASLAGPVLIGWLFALVCGAFVLSYVYLATGHSILCVALWHAGYNMMVATEIGTAWPAAIVGTAVMAWGFIVALHWWRKPLDPPEFDDGPGGRRAAGVPSD